MSPTALPGQRPCFVEYPFTPFRATLRPFPPRDNTSDHYDRNCTLHGRQTGSAAAGGHGSRDRPALHPASPADRAASPEGDRTHVRRETADDRAANRSSTHLTGRTCPPHPHDHPVPASVGVEIPNRRRPATAVRLSAVSSRTTGTSGVTGTTGTARTIVTLNTAQTTSTTFAITGSFGWTDPPALTGGARGARGARSEPDIGPRNEGREKVVPQACERRPVRCGAEVRETHRHGTELRTRRARPGSSTSRSRTIGAGSHTVYAHDENSEPSRDRHCESPTTLRPDENTSPGPRPAKQTRSPRSPGWAAPRAPRGRPPPSATSADRHQAATHAAATKTSEPPERIFAGNPRVDPQVVARLQEHRTTATVSTYDSRCHGRESSKRSTMSVRCVLPRTKRGSSRPLGRARAAAVRPKSIDLEQRGCRQPQRSGAPQRDMAPTAGRRRRDAASRHRWPSGGAGLTRSVQPNSESNWSALTRLSRLHAATTFDQS